MYSMIQICAYAIGRSLEAKDFQEIQDPKGILAN